MAASASLRDKIREQLMHKLGCDKPQALNPRVGKVAKELAVSAEDAMYVLAHENKINISRLDAATLERVRGHLARRDVIHPLPSQLNKPPREAGRRSQGATPRVVNIKIGNVAVSGVPCMGASIAHDARQVAQDAYVKIFLIENSAREMITRVMSAAHGSTWWSSNTKTTIQTKAAKYAANELKNAWHAPRGTDPIQFIDLSDLVAIVDGNWTDFAAIFPKPEWFGNFIDELNVTRRVVAHMNIVDKSAYTLIDAAFLKWTQLLTSRSSDIP